MIRRWRIDWDRVQPGELYFRLLARRDRIFGSSVRADFSISLLYVGLTSGLIDYLIEYFEA